MTTTMPSPRPDSSYQVAVAGRLGPAYRAAIAIAGARRPTSTTSFLLPASSGEDISDVVAMLQARGLVVMYVRMLPRRRP